MHDLASLRQTYSANLLQASRMLREEPIESWEYHSPNVDVYSVEGVDNFFAGETSFAQRYAVGSLWFELMLTVFIEGAPRHYIAIIDARPIGCGDPNVARRAEVDRYIRGDEELVRVLVSEFIQLPERVRLVSIPSLIRLKTVNESDGVAWHPLRHLFESAWITAAHHGEPGHASRFTAYPHKLPCEVTQSRVQVINDLTREKLELVPEADRGVEFPFDKIAIFVFISNDLVRFQLDHVPELRFEFLQLITRPDELNPWPIEWVGWEPREKRNSHGVNSNYGRQEDTEDPKGLRDFSSQARGLRVDSRQGSEAPEALNSQAPPDQVAHQTASQPHSAGYSAKHTHSGSPEDA
jgi:hypothetical protein